MWIKNYIQRIEVNSKVEHLQKTMLLEAARIHTGRCLNIDLSSQVANSWHLNSIISYKCCVTTNRIIIIIIIDWQNFADFIKMF